MKNQDTKLSRFLTRELRQEETLKIKAGYNPWLENDDEHQGD